MHGQLNTRQSPTSDNCLRALYEYGIAIGRVGVATMTYGTRRVDTVNTATEPLHGGQGPIIPFHHTNKEEEEKKTK